MIKEKFYEAIQTPSDINEHMYTLYNLAQECNHITEMGVRNVVSTWAFMYRDPETLIGIDLHMTQNVIEAKKNHPEWIFIEADTTKIEIEQTELLFIDTLHIYSQLKKELELHSKNVSKYIVLHDTTTYGYVDEPTSWQTPEIMENYKVEQKKGLMPAIYEFLELNKQWVIEKQYTNNNGLLILKRINNG